MNNNEWHITLASLATFVLCMFGGCGFLFTGAWWLIALYILAGVVYVGAMAWHLEKGG